MGDLIRLSDHLNPWREVLTLDGIASTLQIYVNNVTGEIDIVQMNDECEAIRTVISAKDAQALVKAIVPAKRASV